MMKKKESSGWKYAEFLLCYVARVMSAEVHETAEISPLPVRMQRRRNRAVYARRNALARSLARVPAKRYAPRVTVNLPHLVHQSVSHHY